MNSHVYWYYVELVYTAKLFGFPKKEIDALLVKIALEHKLCENYMIRNAAWTDLFYVS